MIYYIDTEFLEGTQKEKFPISLFRKNTPPTIDLISIGIVAEDGREFYAISKDFNLKEAWNRWQQRTGEGDRNNIEPKHYWIRENVLRPIFDELLSKSMQDKGDFVKNNFFTAYSGFSYSHLKALINYYGKTNKQIAEEVKEFCLSEFEEDGIKIKFQMQSGDYNYYNCYSNISSFSTTRHKDYDNLAPKIYGYYSAYDHVCLSWLFGKMIDLPKGFPMYCFDLKQLMDEKVSIFCESEIRSTSFESALKRLKEKHPNYPKQTNEHSAIHDARWNKKLHEFLKSI